MASTRLRTAILIISTTAAKDPTTDATGNVLADVFQKDGGKQWVIYETRIVGDVVAQIQHQIKRWADSAVNLIITTGGTGFAVSDQTPEAVSPLLHKQAPGLVHGMLAASLAVTPFAMMARPVAGVRYGTVIVTLPGSPKGARENLQAVIKLLPHACLQAIGEDSRSLHSGGVRKLEQEAGIGTETGRAVHLGHESSHESSHGALVRHTKPDQIPLSNDPSLGPSRRQRESPFPMISVDAASALIAEHSPLLEVVNSKVGSGLVGAVLAQAVEAKENVPAFRASMVDGYAVVVPRDGSLTGIFPVTAVSTACPTEARELREGEVARITTGAPLPSGATAVIMVEDTILKSSSEDGKEEKQVEIMADDVNQGENIREVGSDIQAGSQILEKGRQISAVGGEIGLLAAVGVSDVKIHRRPVLGVLSTGDEIVQHDRPGPLGYGEVRDTNRPMLISAARDRGYEVVDLGIATDEPGRLEETMRDGLRKADVIVTTGGVSMGELDLLKATVERALGGTIHFGRVAMKPGKPTTFATVSVENDDGERIPKLIFSLPGNPASAMVSFHLFVLPALRKMSGSLYPGLPKVLVMLDHDLPVDRTRPEYHRALVYSKETGILHALGTGSQRSSRVGSLLKANALLYLPSGSESLPEGTKVEALLVGDIANQV